jgi:tetratricopeptide (TPR) repeat protein
VAAFKKAVELQEGAEKDASAYAQLKKRFVAERNTDAYRGLALAYLKLGKADEAVETLKRAVDKMPKDASARLALGEAYLAQGNLDGAVEHLAVRLSLEPTTEARLDLARAYTQKHIAKQAEPLYKDVLKAEPDNRAAKMGLVDLYMAMGRYGEVEQMLNAAVKADGNDAQALARLGILKSRMGRPNEALEPLERAVELNATAYDARAELALLYFRADPSNADRCVRMVSDVLLAEPRHASSQYTLGHCLYSIDRAKAEGAFKEALKVDPNFAAAHFSLGELYENAGRKDDARKEYELAAKLDHREAQDALKKLR